MKRKIAIIGASYLQLPLVEKAKDMNLEIHCFAWDDGAVCKPLVDYFYPVSVLDKEDILIHCRDLKINGIVSIASDIVVPTIAYIASELNLVGNTEYSALISTNKHEMRKTLNSQYCPQFTNNFKDALKLDFPIIVKPTNRSGSKGVVKINDPKELDYYFKKATEYSLDGSVIFESFFEGKEYSVESISFNGEHKILAITEKETTGSPQFVETGHHQPAHLSEISIANIENVVQEALSNLNITVGASHTELLINSSGEIRIIEVGARMGGDFIGSHLVELSTGFDYLKAVIDIAMGDYDPNNNTFAEKKHHAGIHFAYNLESYNLIKGYSENQNIIERKLSNDEPSKTVIESAQRSGYMIYQSTNKIEL